MLNGEQGNDNVSQGIDGRWRGEGTATKSIGYPTHQLVYKSQGKV